MVFSIEGQGRDQIFTEERTLPCFALQEDSSKSVAEEVLV